MIKLTKLSKRKISAVKQYAESHVLTEKEIRKMQTGALPPIGDTPEHECHLPIGYRVVFSNEHQPCGLCKHISFSRKDKPLQKEDVSVILEAFDMDELNAQCENQYVYREDGGAFNIIQITKDGKL